MTNKLHFPHKYEYQQFSDVMEWKKYEIGCPLLAHQHQHRQYEHRCQPFPTDRQRQPPVM